MFGVGYHAPDRRIHSTEVSSVVAIEPSGAAQASSAALLANFALPCTWSARAYWLPVPGALIPRFDGTPSNGGTNVPLPAVASVSYQSSMFVSTGASGLTHTSS